MGWWDGLPPEATAGRFITKDTKKGTKGATFFVSFVMNPRLSDLLPCL